MDSNTTPNATEISLKNYLCNIHKNPVINIIYNALEKTQNAYPELTKDGLYICSGILFQTIWNMNLNKHLMYGISDIDIIWFDPNHTSCHEEDTVIKDIETFTKHYLRVANGYPAVFVKQDHLSQLLEKIRQGLLKTQSEK